MKISEASKRCGLSITQIRQFIKYGGLDIKKSPENGYAEFMEDDIELLCEAKVYLDYELTWAEIVSVLKSNEKDRQRVANTIISRRLEDIRNQEVNLGYIQRHVDNSSSQINLNLKDIIGDALKDFFGNRGGEYFYTYYDNFLDIELINEDQKKCAEYMKRYLQSSKVKIPWVLNYQMGLMAESITPILPLNQVRQLQDVEKRKVAVEDWKKRAEIFANAVMWWHPVQISSRRFRTRLLNAGFYHNFVPALRKLNIIYDCYIRQMEEIHMEINDNLGWYKDSLLHN